MDNNNIVKAVGAAILLIAVFFVSRFHGGTPPSAVPPSVPPSITVDAPAEPRNRDSSENRRTEIPTKPDVVRHGGAANSGARHDLEQDEQHHGHTLRKHVGRTDEQLLERLKEERNISSASTYTDREAAERTVGLALEQHKNEIDAWVGRGANRPNLAFDYSGDGRTVIGRSIHRNATHSVPCHQAKVVLAATGDGYFVLTSYPEAR